MNIGLLAVDREKAKREAYKKLCYNFEYKFGSNIPHCVLRSGVCDEDCEYMKVFTIKGMNIDTEFNVGDSVCYLIGDNIIHTTISKIIIEISYADDIFLMVYKLSDGLSVPRNNYPKWDKRLFKDKESLIKYLSES
ncbi:hypothetical protein NXU98_08425 [Parabacteroides distasonis]|nr:hypothetical protein NXU98_08425 [Parabacteroides distasonis]